MHNDKLLKCPFCGGEFEEPINTASKQGDTWLWSTECMGCGLFIDDKDKDNLIKRVNTRKPMGDVASKVQQVIWDSCSGDEYKYASKEIEKIFDEVYVEGGVDNATN